MQVSPVYGTVSVGVFHSLIFSDPDLVQVIHHCYSEFVSNRLKGESRNGSFKKTKHAKFSEKRTFLNA